MNFIGCLNIHISTQGAEKVTNLGVGSFVVAPFLGSVYRAKVLDVLRNGQVRVIFVDFGNLAVVASHELMKLKPEFSKLPAQAAPCRLHGVCFVVSGRTETKWKVCFNEMSSVSRVGLHTQWYRTNRDSFRDAVWGLCSCFRCFRCFAEVSESSCF